MKCFSLGFSAGSLESSVDISIVQNNHRKNMEKPGTGSNSSSFEDLAKDNDVKDGEADDGFMDILGNQQLTKKVGQIAILSQLRS